MNSLILIDKIKFVINHKGFKKYFFNTSWLFAEQILRMIAGLLVGVWVARYLGPKQLGIFSYSLAFVAIFSGISKLGLDSIVIREIVRSPERCEIYLGTAFWMKIFGSIITFGLVILTSNFTNNSSLTNLYIYIIAAGMIFQSFEVVDFYFQAKVLSKYISVSKIIQLLLSSLMKIYFLLTAKPLLWFVVVSLIDQILLAITYLIMIKLKRIEIAWHKIDFAVFKMLFKDSWPLILSSLAVMLYMRIDQIMIKNMLGDREVGLYSVAVQLSEVWYFIPVLITSSLFPAIVSAKKISEKLYYERLQRLYGLMIWLAIGIAIVMTVLSNKLILFLYGIEYIETVGVLKIYVWAGIFVFLGVASGKWYITDNLQKISTLNTIAGAGLNIFLNFLLIKEIGIVGAAISTLLSYSLSAYFMNLLYRQTRRNSKLITSSLLPKKRKIL
ncbi:MAG: flippase [Candidatus Cloacimonetes bacterium]|nr:flippase [Candidatus Cloacimonadota bacterium]